MTRMASAGQAAQNPNMNPKAPKKIPKKPGKKNSNFFQKSKEDKALLRDHATIEEEIKFVQHQIFTPEREGRSCLKRQAREERKRRRHTSLET
jgi:hypothetical protein